MQIFRRSARSTRSTGSTKTPVIAFAGWFLFTIGSFLLTTAYAPGARQLISAAGLMLSGLFLLRHHLLHQNHSGWKKWSQRLNYGATLFFIPGFLAIGSYGFLPGKIQLISIYGMYLAIWIYLVNLFLFISVWIVRQFRG